MGGAVPPRITVKSAVNRLSVSAPGRALPARKLPLIPRPPPLRLQRLRSQPMPAAVLPTADVPVLDRSGETAAHLTDGVVRPRITAKPVASLPSVSAPDPALPALSCLQRLVRSALRRLLPVLRQPLPAWSRSLPRCRQPHLHPSTVSCSPSKTPRLIAIPPLIWTPRGP